MNKKPKYPKVIETFRQVGNYELTNLTRSHPSTFNGEVCIRRYRVTVELIDEPVEVLHARLLQLWRECDNIHHWEPLKHAAKQLGTELPRDQLGVDRRKGK